MSFAVHHKDTKDTKTATEGSRLPLLAGVWVALAATLALHFTSFHVVPSEHGVWRGVSELPSGPWILASVLGGLLAAWALGGQRPRVQRPLLALLLALTPALPLLSGRGVLLLLFQGPMLVVLCAAVLALAICRGWADAAPWGRIPGAVLFAAAFLFYALLGLRIPGPAGPQGDEPHHLTMAHSLLHDHDLDLTDEFAGREYQSFFAGRLEAHTSPASPRGRIYPIHAPGLAALIVPAYAAGGYPGVKLFLAAVAALTTLLLRDLVRDVTGQEPLGLACWAALTFTPPFPFYAVAVYPETVAALATVVFLRSSRRDPGPGDLVLASLAAALLPWLHPKFLPLAALGLGLTVARRGPRIPRLLAVAALTASLAALLVFFHAVYGRASLAAAYGPGVAEDVALSRIPAGLAALTLDRQFGLLAVGPLWVLALPGLWLLLRTRTGDGLRALLFGGATLAVGASYSMWWGGACPPARFVIPALPALAVALAPALPRWRDAAAALFGVGLAIVALAADAPRALHNRADGESGLLRYLAPSLDLDPSLPSFVKVGLPTLLLCATLLAVLALAWWRGKRGLLAGAAAYGLLAAGLRDTPLLDARLSTLRLLEAWDPARIRGCSGPLELGRLRVPIELRGAPWVLREGLLFNSGRLDLPPGLYRLEVDGRTLEAPPRSKTVRVDLTAGELLLERVYLEQARPRLTIPLLLPAGARRLVLTAVGVQGAMQIGSAELAPLALVPSGQREEFAWPRQPDDEHYRVGPGEVHVTALDRSRPVRDGFSVEEAVGSFLVDAPAGTPLVARLVRSRPSAADVLECEGREIPLGSREETLVALPAEAGIRLLSSVVVPVQLRAYGAWITFSGSPGGTSATESRAASPGDLPIVMTTSPPPDSGKK